MSDALCVPLKKSWELNLEDSLRGFLAPYVAAPGSEIGKAVKELDKLRKDVVSKKPIKSVFLLEQLNKYHDQIAVLATKFPVETLIPFTWEDAFSKASVFSGKPTLALAFLGYEKHCVLFNIAALQTQLAVDCTIVDTDDERKTATKYFQSASGIFDQLKPSESAGDNLTPDFHPDMLSALSSIMLAQSQEMFVTKAIKGKMKDAIIAKVCIQTEEMFSEILLKMTRDTVKYSWDKSWLHNVKGKKFIYFGLANFFESKVCDEKKQVGEQIARLNVCIENLKKGQDKIGNPNFQSYFVSEAKRLLAAATKDNDFIYHEPVPLPSNLPTIPKVANARFAKVTPVPDIFAVDFNNPFVNMEQVVDVAVEPEHAPQPVAAPIPAPEVVPEPVVEAPSAPPRKKKNDETNGNPYPELKADESNNFDSPAEVNEPKFTKSIAKGGAPTWSQVMSDSWTLVKPYFDEVVFGKKTPTK